jgi:hypothetical protein
LLQGGALTCSRGGTTINGLSQPHFSNTNNDHDDESILPVHSDDSDDCSKLLPDDNASDHNTTLSSFSYNQEKLEHIKYPLIELESDLSNKHMIMTPF